MPNLKTTTTRTSIAPITFAPQKTFAVGYHPRSLSVADVNGDGNADVITANMGDNNISVLMGDGKGSFAPQTTFDVGISPNSVSVADVDGDGNADVITANGDNNISILMGDGKGSFAKQKVFAVGSEPSSISVADVDGDGKLDVVTANMESDNVSVSVLLGDGRGNFAPPTTFEVGSLTNSVSVADVNGDGKQDLVTANYGNGSVSVLLGDEKGSFAPPTTFEVVSEYYSPYFGMVYSPNFVSVADVNSDGKQDLVTANDDDDLGSSISVLLGDGKGSFAPLTTFSEGASSDFVSVADVSGDGKQDLITVYSYDSNVSVLLGDGKGSFALPTTFAVEYVLNSLNLADVNGDGKLDLVTVNDNDRSVSILLNTPHNNSSGNVTITGILEQNKTLTINNTLTDIDGLGTISYQWQSNNVDISNATQGTYVLTQSDVGKNIGVVASYTDKLGTVESITSTTVLKVKNINDLPTGAVTISGTPKIGQTLMLNNRLADIDGLGKFSYQWQANDKAIKGATAENYTLVKTDFGKTISVKVSYTDGQGTKESVTSLAVKNVNDLPTGEVLIYGEPKEGKTLTVSNTLADEDGLGTISYQWQADGKIIKGATSESYTLTPAEHGKAISVKASYTDGQGTKESVTSEQTDLVTNHAPTGEIVINGAAKVGEVLSIVNTLADVDGLGDFSYQWLINGDDPIMDNVMNDIFIVPELDHMGNSTIGAVISVKVGYFDGEGTDEVVVSKPTQAVVAASSVPSDGNDKLIGTEKNDKLSALAGNDTLIGGAGADNLTGGSEGDIFKFIALSDSGITSKTRDTITDFRSGADKIDLSAIDANEKLAGNQAFTFIGSSAFSKTNASGQLRFDSTSKILYASTDADSSPEFSIQLSGVKNLTLEDFIL